ncbi:hypothetical protein HQ633_12755, partial [Enterococcus faecium]|nr:hypothetical protein [Enterococcus faecium]
AIISILLASSPVFADFNESNTIGTTTTEKDEDGKTKTIITVKDRQIESYTSTDAATSSNNSSVSINATFFNDRYSDKLTTLLSFKGFIPSGRRFTFPPRNSWLGFMLWPYKYSTTITNISLDKPVKIIESTPSNTIKNKEVSDSIVYGVGGGVKLEGKTPGASLDANAAFSKTISYQQPDYETIKTSGTTQKTSWDTVFTETTDGYTRTSWNSLFGNGLFMVGLYTYDVKKNFTPDYKLSQLITGGFSPEYGLVLNAPKEVKKSQIKVQLSRVSETYRQEWTGFNWFGRNYLDQNTSDWSSTSSLLFEIDWEKHTVKFIA